LCICAAIVADSSSAIAKDRGFTVSFKNCSEFAGEGYINYALAKGLVPHGYTITGSSSSGAATVVRATQCGAVTVDDGPAVRTNLSQIGINVVSPDGTGTINNYTLLYISDNPYLVRAFQRAGVPARFSPNLTYEYTLDSAGTAGALYVAVPDAGIPAYFIYGPETEPAPNSQELFIANWWFGPDEKIRQNTTFPAIAFGTSSVTLYTSKYSDLGRLIGGNAYGKFSVLSLRGEYASATMHVTVKDR